jgi:hypothetical protein
MGRHSLLAIAEVKAFLEGYLKKAGTISSIQGLHRAYNETVGKIVAKPTFYRLPKRQGWNKRKPDAAHALARKETQGEPKKRAQGSYGQER